MSESERERLATFVKAHQAEALIEPIDALTELPDGLDRLHSLVRELS